MIEPLTIIEPSLAINRLKIYRRGNAVYDQPFYQGVNIIRGANGSGKSSIIDFIFHVLGGEVLNPTNREWKEHAGLCDAVVAEVTLNDATVTVRREVSAERARPMHVFFDRIEVAEAHAIEGWQQFPYSRSAEKEAFSQILFRALKLPEATTPEGSVITMHQILRLLYSDQMTPVQRIFRFENFDPPILKQAIGDFLCGVGGFELYEKQLEVRQLKAKFDAIVQDLKGITSIAANLDAPLNWAALRSEIDQLGSERSASYVELEAISRSEFGVKADTKIREDERRRAFGEVGKILAKIQSLEMEVRTLQFEVQDSELFLEHLARMLDAIDQASVSYEELGGIHFQYCPACFNATEPVVPAHHCHLCKTLLDESKLATRSLAVKLDLQIQMRESRQLQDERKAVLDVNVRALRAVRRDHASKAAAYDALARAPVSARDAKIAKLNQRIGFIDSSLETLNERLELAAKIGEMTEEKAKLNDQMSRTQDAINAIVAAQNKRKREAYTRVVENVLQLLRNDTGDQDAFVEAETASFSFGNDVITVDGKSNFAASSLVILKNSFHLGMLMASLSDPLFLLPRFMLFDNIEDKGMVPERSWNFQKQICSASLASRVQHQIIFTTSMFDPKTDPSAHLIGPVYSKQNRTLNFK